MTKRKRYMSSVLAVVAVLSSQAGQPKGRAADAPIRGHIRVGSAGWGGELAAAAKAYQKQHPEVTITFSDDYLNVPGRLLRGEIDLASYTGNLQDHTGGPDIEKFSKGFPQESIERTVGYWPFAVVVHPANPMRSITVEQLRRMMTDNRTSWSDIGRPTDGTIRLYIALSYLVRRALVGDNPAASKAKKPSAEAVDKPALRVTHISGRELPALADDPNGIAIVYHDKKLVASGYKILPVFARPNDTAYAPTDTAAVARGDYPLRTPLKVLIPASAPAHVKAFVEWLSTAEAAEPFKAAPEDPRRTWPAAHISEASAPAAAVAPPETPTLKPPAKPFAGPIEGAVAVLPIEQLSVAFRMSERSHHAAYEQAICDAVAADGRLTMIDRTQLARVLAERKFAILGLEDAPPGAIVSADVLVVTHLLTESLKPYLRIRAVHGSTGGLLAELKLRIDPAKPAVFDPPLAQAVAGWWPDVLRKLRDSRLKPAWVLMDVYPQSLELTGPAEALRGAMQQSLDANPAVFAPGDLAVDEAQQEMLMRMLGLARPAAGRLTPLADYIVDARLAGPFQLDLRLRDAALGVLAEKTISGLPDALASAAGEWLRRQIAANPGRPAPATAPAAEADDWAVQQAKVELEMTRQLKMRGYALHQKSLQVFDPQVEAAMSAAKAHARRAAQLDPTNDEAAFEALPDQRQLVLDWVWQSDNISSFRMILASSERFLSSFPKSKYHADVLVYHANACCFLADKAPLPKGPEGDAVRIACRRQAVADVKLWLALYGNSEKPRMTFHGYLVCLFGYLDLARPPAAETDAIVADWSKDFDGRSDMACHSDFVRLAVLKHRKDRAGFIDLLTKMQQRWPDPNHPQWARTAGLVDGMIFNLFKGFGSDKSSFQLWHRGLRGIGDIPKVGYNPQDDIRRYNCELMFSCPGPAAGAKEPIRRAGLAYKKLQPGLDVGFLGRASLLEAVVTNLSVPIWVGRIPPDDLKGILEFYRTKDLPLRRIGYFRGPGNAAAREVSILLPSRGLTEGPLSDFLHFLGSPDGRKVLAENGIHASADVPASQPATQPARATTPLGKTTPGE